MRSLNWTSSTHLQSRATGLEHLPEKPLVPWMASAASLFSTSRSARSLPGPTESLVVNLDRLILASISRNTTRIPAVSKVHRFCQFLKQRHAVTASGAIMTPVAS